MPESDETTKIIRIVDKRLEESGIREAGDRARWLTRLVYTVISIMVIGGGAGVGFGLTVSRTVSAQGSKITANDHRIEAIEQCVAVIQGASLETARSVGRMEGMLAAMRNTQ